ncbi:MAG: glycosyltransferase family 39 protein [Candidatus Hydrogenedentota bacterium]
MIDSKTTPWWRADTAVLGGIAFAKFLLHLTFINQYGYFRDEFYYLACGRHLDWGYVDFPPVIGVIGAFVQGVLGDSLPAVRLFPILAGAGLVFVTGLIAREFGGKRFAQGMAALCALVAPVLLGNHHFFGVNAFEQFLWVLAIYVFVRILRTGNLRLWLLFGLVAGMGLMTKLTFLFFGVSVLFGLVLTRHRKSLLTPWPWLGGLIALAIFSPHILWQIAHDWPTLKLTSAYASGKTYHASLLEAVYMQVLSIHPISVPIWLAGLWFLFRDKEGARYRAVGWGFLLLATAFIALNAKFYWLAPAHCAILAGGACALEGTIRNRGWGWLKVAYPAALVITGALTAPLALPILPPPRAAAFHALLGGDVGLKHENVRIRALPQHFADMFGWEEMVALVADVYESLPEEENGDCIILTDNYGNAGAIDLLGKKYGLPRAVSTHNNYHLWGPGEFSTGVVITVGIDEDELKTLFDEVTLAARFSHPYCMPSEDNKPIFICRGLRVDLEKAWAEAGNYI